MSNAFKIEIINPEKSFLNKDNIFEVVVPAFEGDLGILKDHISIISFLRPGLIRITDSNAGEEKFYVEDGIIEFKNNCLSILTSNIFDIKKIDKNKVKDILAQAEDDRKNQNISDQEKYLIDHKVEVLKSLN